MRWKWCVIAVALLLPCTSRAAVPELPRDLPELWFPVGERLDYRLYWGIIPVGHARVESGWKHHDGRWLLSLRVTARTGRFVSKIYPVDDRIESLVDPVTFTPVQYRQVLNEGKKHRDDLVTFDYARGIATVHDRIDESAYDVAIDADTRDILTFIYYMRSKGYESGQTQDFRVLVEDKVYDLTLRGLEEQTIDLPGIDDLPTLKLEPKARFGEIFNRKGEVHAWFSSDTRRLCAKMTGRVPLADVKAVLVEVSGPGSDAWPSSG